MRYLTFDTKEQASKEAYLLLKQHIDDNSTLGLATGSTPLDLYKEIIAQYNEGNIDFSNIKTFNLDEYVGIDYNHPESYHKFMEEKLFNHININKDNINIPDASADNLDVAIADYRKKLNSATIDVQILGLGANGHIGFNEPGTSFDSTVHVVDLAEDTIKANSRFFDGDITKVPTKAVTMGISDIMRAKTIILLAFGKEKQDAIQHLMTNDIIDESIPCTILKKHPNVFILVDKDADCY